MRKWLLATAICFVSATSWAAAFEPFAPVLTQPKQSYGRFYVGGSLGVDKHFYDLKINTNDTQDGNLVDFNEDIAMHGFSGRAHGGWGWNFASGLYMGAEANITYSDNKLNTSVRTLDGTTGQLDRVGVGAKATYRYGIDGVLGYKVNEYAMPFIQGGYSRSRVSTELTDETGTFRLNKRQNRGGYDIGGGLNVMVFDYVSMFVKYEYLRYDSFDRSYNDSDNDLIVADFRRPRVSNTSIGLNFYF